MFIGRTQEGLRAGRKEILIEFSGSSGSTYAYVTVPREESEAFLQARRSIHGLALEPLRRGDAAVHILRITGESTADVMHKAEKLVAKADEILDARAPSASATA